MSIFIDFLQEYSAFYSQIINIKGKNRLCRNEHNRLYIRIMNMTIIYLT